MCVRRGAGQSRLHKLVQWLTKLQQVRAAYAEQKCIEWNTAAIDMETQHRKAE